ncbi:MAG: DNA polymerase III subunit gamma/tau [Alistipes sp.]|nr:DNA polymerase III subunit gamma/tau [Alistipes sp.]
MENFIVSARKYRPATFRSVVGQNHITSTLQNAIGRGQLAHAYLFCGPRGVGKTTCARIFAKAINCQNPGADYEACGECESCRGFDEGRSFNIHELDAASNNSIDDIRNLTDQVRIPPQLGRYSVYIIDEVHMLSAAAFNAFLKTLEEPPAHAIFILATTEKHKIIPTILSRCQIFDFNRIKVSDGVDYMKHIASEEGVAYDEESLNLIARKADGGMRDALSMFDKAVSFCGPALKYKEVATSLNILDYDTYFDVVDVISAGDYGAVLLMFDRVLALGFSGQTFMSGLGSHLRDLLVARNAKTAELLDVTGPLMQRYLEQAVRCAPGFLFGAIALCADIDGRINSATNQRLLVELALMKLCNLASPDGGEKKNSDGIAPDVSLPPLRHNAGLAERPAAGSPAAESVAVGKASAENLSAQTPATDIPATKATSTESSAAASTSSTPLPAPAPVSAPVPATTPQQQPTTSGNHLSSTITGRPLSEIMAGTATGTTDPTAEDSQRAEKSTDPAAAEKIDRHREKFLERLARERPRIGVAWETMTAEGDTVTIRVASTALRDEVMRLRTETLQLLATVAGVVGALELQVVVDESIKPSKPVRVEDRLRHLTELNPALTDLRKTLELEIE